MLWPSTERFVETLVTPQPRAPSISIKSDGPPKRPELTTVSRGTKEPRVRRIPRFAQVRPVVPEPTIPAAAFAGTRQTPPAASGFPVGTSPTRESRWSASAWGIARGIGDATLAPGGTLGGSQVGVRVAWRPTVDAPVALFGRVSRPLRTPGAEAAIGIEVKPVADLPVRVALEQRFALERGAAEGTALSLIGGVSEVALPGGFRLDGYGQAGIIGLRRRTTFVDGAATVTRPLVSLGDADIAVGAGLWGAAQPGLARLDIGPRAEVRVPIAGERIRLGVEWRERVAGNARPGSGPAVTIGADF